jgi:hypothetical protein
MNDTRDPKENRDIPYSFLCTSNEYASIPEFSPRRSDRPRAEGYDAFKTKYCTLARREEQNTVHRADNVAILQVVSFQCIFPDMSQAAQPSRIQ